MIVHITRYIVREKHKYMSRYSSHTRYVYEIDGKRKDFGTGFYVNYKSFIAATKKRFGEDAEYKIDYEKPYVYYL